MNTIPPPSPLIQPSLSPLGGPPTPSFLDITQWETYDWSPSPSLSIDENYLDLCMMLMRTSIALQGFMGCLLVKGEPPSYTRTSYFSQILTCSINTPFFTSFNSEVHAEINSISAAARSNINVDGSTAYISMPPCKNCFMSLKMAGVGRIVSRNRLCETITDYLTKVNTITYLDIPDTDISRERRLKIVEVTGRGVTATKEKIQEERKKRKIMKEEERERKRGNRERREKEKEEREKEKGEGEIKE
ncbi:hypothetical protein TrLO_g1619 [Triparma laevis f. longispina]|uniref:CMP/dCMP-type deaminase domain-containing protein n=1 Tax=Triparma laevis f. longispina TaxID=1714387 RepID=A0A9W7E8X1_9STRA|nr:hypothetical protein TrLO_g1619 [Triparma laevis f. longispina]